MAFHNFDNALTRIYDCNSRNDPLVYVATHFDLLRSQVDIFVVENKINPKKHSELFQIIKNHENECIQNCCSNFNFLQDKFNRVIERRIKLYHEQGNSKKFDEKNIENRIEWIETRKDIFKKNAFFLEYFGKKKVGYFVMTEYFCLDDLQIEIIK